MWVIVAITWLVAAANLTHIIAGSVEVLYLVSTGVRSWSAYALHDGLPVFRGNTIGGVLLVAMLNCAQIESE